MILTGSLSILYNKKLLIEDGWEMLSLQKQSFDNMVQSAIDDALFFKNLFATELASNENRRYQSVLEQMTQHILHFHSVHLKYSVMRFLDIDGNEIIRTNKSSETGQVSQAKSLQNKKYRGYFKKSIRLKDNEVYISPLNFNMEYKKILAPYRPTVRVVTPLIVNQKKLGLIVLNIAVPYFIATLKKIDKISKGNIIFLANHGYCLMYSPSKYRWNRLLKEDKQKKLLILYPKSLQPALDTTRNEQLNTKYGIFLCAPLHYAPKKNIYSDLNSTLLYFLPHYIILGLSIWLVICLIIFLVFLAVLIGTLWGNLTLRKLEFDRTIKKMARTDALTGLMNRYAFNEQFAYEANRQARYPSTLSIAMIDIDHFKQLNDKYGHIIADEVLKKLSSLLKNNLRIIDFICRFGGEEFIILLPQTSLHRAKVVFERIRLAIEKEKFELQNQCIQFTISIGITQWTYKTDTINKVLTRVDKLLYKAKSQGRNRIVTHK